jgi:hypothetical protein
LFFIESSLFFIMKGVLTRIFFVLHNDEGFG